MNRCVLRFSARAITGVAQAGLLSVSVVGAAWADPAATASTVSVGGTVFVNIVAYNKSAIPTTGTGICNINLSFTSAPGRSISVKAQITPTAVTCTAKIPYLIENPIAAVTMTINTYMTVYKSLAPNLPLGVQESNFVALPLFTAPLPNDGATTVKTFPTVI